MKSCILQENVLTDNVLYIADNGKVFKGGYVAMIEEWKFQNSWSDKKSVVNFRSLIQLQKYLKKNYPNFEYYF